MRRLRRFTWLLWLIVALLPLRGLAMAAFAAAGEPPPVMAVEPAPCPMHADAASLDATPAPACALCDVCHLVAMPAGAGDSATDAKPQGAPLPTRGLGAGRAPADDLFRPPR